MTPQEALKSLNTFIDNIDVICVGLLESKDFLKLCREILEYQQVHDEFVEKALEASSKKPKAKRAKKGKK